MTALRASGTTGAVSGFLLDRAHLLLPIAAQLGPSQPDFESTIHGNSMAPAIPGGARIRVRVGARGSSQIGDVVFYLADDGYTVHRILHRMRAAGADYLLTAGDARFAPDPPVPGDQVLGTVVAIESNGQWRAPGPEGPAPWRRRAVRAMTLPAMIVTARCSIVAANRLAAALLGIESRVRLTRRRLLRSLRG